MPQVIRCTGGSLHVYGYKNITIMRSELFIFGHKAENFQPAPPKKKSQNKKFQREINLISWIRYDRRNKGTAFIVEGTHQVTS